jgi:glycerol-3-phosphate acyltransferase PlsY
VAPFVAFTLGQSEVAVIFGALAVLLWIKHLTNIQRLLMGRESRIGGKSS